MATILQSEFFVELILPFLLVFVVIFAILQKAKIFGDGKKQIDALVALVIGLIFVAFGNAVGIILNLMPFLAVSAVIILVFMILYGMLFKEGEFEMHKGLKIGFGIIIGLAVLIAVLVVTGSWDIVTEMFYGEASGELMANIIIVIVIIAAMIIMLIPGKNSAKSDE